MGKERVTNNEKLYLQSIGLKRCSKCKQPKSPEFYNKDRYNFMGLKTECRECQKRHRCPKNTKWTREYDRKRYQEYKIYNSISACIRYSLKGNKNGMQWEDLVGYSIDQLKNHLQSLFQPGMKFDNHGIGEGKWNIDHKIPIKYRNIDGTFYWNQKDLQNPYSQTFKDCWALSNLQPKWSIPNIKKSNKYRE